MHCMQSLLGATLQIQITLVTFCKQWLWQVLTLVLSLLLLGQTLSVQQLTEDEKPTQESKNSVTREEFEFLQRHLNYWQNTTINILKKYGNLLDREVWEDGYLKDRVEDLVEGVRNHTQDINAHLLGVEKKIDRIEEQISHPPLGSFLNPVSSCKFIPKSSPSGHYWIQHTGTGYATLDYCDMTRRCCNSTGGWMRVAHLNMTDSSQQCPSGFRLITSPKRTCGTPGSKCVSTTFPLDGIKYSRVCGKINGYQYASPDAFWPYYNNRAVTIDNAYVDGVSLTHGQRPRNHIWTFAAAVDEIKSDHSVCPCTKTNTCYTGVVPPFIGEDYFCDSGSTYGWRYQFYSVDPLWDGSGCRSTSSCCGFNNPPWFCKQLPQPTTDDIEMRVCVDQPTNDEDIALESVEIYVQ